MFAAVAKTIADEAAQVRKCFHMEVIPMPVELIAHPGVDSAFIAWRAPFIDECRGFALKRRIKRAPGSATSPNTIRAADPDGFVEEIVASWVGFANGPAADPGTRKPTTEWPIQKYLWSDFMVNPGDTVAYRVVPMTGTADALEEAQDEASAWSPLMDIGAETDGHASCFFNRGIVASQWLARLLPEDHPSTKLAEVIATPGDKIRNFLGGPARNKLVSLLTEANAAQAHVYAALFELDDPELVPLLKAFGKRAHVVLGNGSVKHKGDDENADARSELEECDLKDRMTAPRALAHNKFLVICDENSSPQSVWTGSTNWTKTGLCTQANNALLVNDPVLAQFYVDQWDALASAGDVTPPDLYEANASPRTPARGGPTTLWFTPMHEQLDLEQAGELIANAQEGILFLMFNPGPRGTLLNDIIELASPSSPKFNPDLYIQGVVNQNPGTAKNPVTLFNRGDRIDANEDVVLPAAIPGALKFWLPELLKLPRAHAMVHSKVVVVDPYGANPVVMTGSHNMGPKASGVNDENLILIQGNGNLASQYAGKIMEIYSQYRWRASVQAEHGKPKWQGLADDDKWQIRDPSQGYDKRRVRELDFWFGSATVPTQPQQVEPQRAPAARTRTRSRQAQTVK
jgi:phosphatidylserine/phosphatidylglycerophosphate/cardiolipin synthase-like enzyme